MNFDQPSITALKKQLEAKGPAVVTAHTRPDGDAIGSSLAMAHMLRKMGIEADVIMPDQFDRYLSWMPGTDKVQVAQEALKPARKKIQEASTIFIMDYSEPNRAGVISQVLNEAEAFKVMVDHHLNPADFTDMKFHVSGASSTAELVYKLFEDLEITADIDEAIATCLYVGIMTDTGSFRFSNTTPAVHRITSDLLSRGIDVGKIQNAIFNNFSESRTRFLGYILNEKLKVLPEYKTAYMTMSDEELKKFNIGHGDTEGFVNYNLSMEGINFGALLKQGGDKIKLSFRSIGEFPCNEFAANFSGGGHHNAAGGISWDSLENTEQKFLTLLEDFKDKLDY